MKLADWTAGGARVQLNGHRLFVRQDGDGRPVTLVHGFPTSSHDWAPTVPELVAAGHRVTTLDLLGFGQSDKPPRHRYSVHEQADLIEALWEHLGIGETALVAHDYGVSVAQELLARDPARITRTALLNGGLYADLHRPIPMQRLLHSRVGPLLARLTDEKRFTANLRSVLGRPVQDEVLHDMWTSVAHDNGHHLAPRLLRYIDDRRAHFHRWTGSLERYEGPLLFVWGPEDPVSGAHVLDRLRRRCPRADFTVLTGVGHYPQLEAPEETARALAAFLTDRTQGTAN
ncbi:alpha/beta fold hydrolase [Streptomyces echinatus]|uniref:Pimeloyl-ACP methyl ester carboxylesterase n=1 Tax=Streptomyces echinatus TaxID=67293 RepID=A0A7W9UW87_9ACTN|nr:alpha/beta hydrolase [Streptomyces echinatus]MBB5932414.1 pimeloyl-ACP methyl ester carboxylesterase [Streptomyces echinatus]